MLNARLNRTPLTSSMRMATAAVLLIATMSIAGAVAQSQFATMSGTVLDQTNAFLPDTTLVLTNAASKARHEVQSDATGHFEFVGLPPGEYRLQATQRGFAPLSEPITIAGRDLTKTYQLQVGSLQETINVTGDPEPARSAVDPERAKKIQAARAKAEERQQRATARCAAAPGGGIGGNILQPSKIVDVRPKYPEHLTGAGIGGTVIMDALVGTDGTVRDVRVVSAPHPDLERAAIDAVRQWEFTTTMLNCTPIDVHLNITANFVAPR